MVSAKRGLGLAFSFVQRSRPSSTAVPARATPLVLVDGTSLVYRSFFAMPSFSRPADNGAHREVGALMGFCNTMMSLLLPFPPSPSEPTVVVLFDSSGPTFRDELFDRYKGQRPAPPKALGPQMDLAVAACAAFGWPVFSAPGFEADDLIATLSSTDRARPTAIIGSDKDLFQLVSDSVCVMCPSKKKLFTAADVREKFGVGPELMVDLQSLCGDSADNVVGVPGVGPVTAAALLREWGSLEGVLAAAQQNRVKQAKRRLALVEHRESALLAKRLVTLRTDVPHHALVPAVGSHLQLRAMIEAPTFTNLGTAERFAEEQSLFAVARAIRRLT